MFIKMGPLVSIGIPVKNGFLNKPEFNLSKCLDSIINQSYQNIEIIISNNCSNDKTEEYLNEMIKTDKRIKYFNQENEISWAQNFKFVLNKSNGKYFRWNAADDYISKDYILENVQFLENNSDYVSSSSKFYYESDKDKIHTYDLNKDLFDRINGFFNIRHMSHNILYSLINKKKMLDITDISKDYWAVDWMLELDLLNNGKFKTIEKGYVGYGTNGMSRQKNFIKRDVYTNNFLYKIFPFHKLMVNLFKKTISSKHLSFYEKIYLNYRALKMNFYFFKKVFEQKNRK